MKLSGEDMILWAWPTGNFDRSYAGFGHRGQNLGSVEGSAYKASKNATKYVKPNVCTVIEKIQH